MHSGSCRNRGFGSTRFVVSLKHGEPKETQIPHTGNNPLGRIIGDAMHFETWETWDYPTFPTFLGVVLPSKRVIPPEDAFIQERNLLHIFRIDSLAAMDLHCQFYTSQVCRIVLWI